VRPRDPAGGIRDLVEGIGPPDFGLQAPCTGAAGGISGHGAGGGAGMPTASGLPVARRDAALVQAGRPATSTSFSLCCDDDQDGVGERPRPEW
jgi:hypothetical protein